MGASGVKSVSAQFAEMHSVQERQHRLSKSDEEDNALSLQYLPDLNPLSF
jgi:hypothetical protein